MKFKNVFILLLLVLLCSCTSSKSIVIADNISVELLGMDVFDSDFDTYRLFTGSFPEMEQISAEAYIVSQDNTLALYVFAPTGQTLATISYDGNNATIESDFFPEYDRFAAMIVMDIQLCYGNEDKLKECLEKKGLGFSQIANEFGYKREITKRDKVICEITVSQNCVRVDNYYRGYSYISECLD